MFSYTATVGKRASSSRLRLTLRRDRELLSMTAGIEMGCWFTSSDEGTGEVLRVWDGVRRELITYTLRASERVDASARMPADASTKRRCPSLD